MPDPLLDDLLALLYLVRVVECGSFTKAAAKLGVSKSVVSEKVSALETRLGEQLLLRTTRNVTPTHAGTRVYSHARQMVEAGRQATRDSSAASGGVVRLSAPVSLGQLFLARPIAEFLSAHPRSRIELLLNDRLVDLIEERIDLALRITKLKDSSLLARRLGWTTIHVCGSPSYFAEHGRPKRPEDLVRHNCMRYAYLRPDHEWRLYSEGGRVPLELTGSFETTNGTMLREAAIAGAGLAILPRFMIADALRAGTLETVLDSFGPRPMGIYAVRSGRPTPPKLVAELIAAFEAAFQGPDWQAPVPRA
ncbi:MAG TPA: LysR substrate-binding domain-containing protein [Polyangiaceae bacterium]|nr:LysR substrate-binding domain-containing protein [Polyangiaceae bacterium]